MQNAFPDLQTRQNPAALWDFVKNDFKNRVDSNEELSNLIFEMTPEERENFKADSFNKYASKPEYSVILEPERKERKFVPGPYGGNFINATVPAKTRPLQDMETEKLWSVYKNPEAYDGKDDIPGIKNLSDTQRKSLLQIAEAENSPFAPWLKFDSKYLQYYHDALDAFEKDARKFQADGGDWRNKWYGEVARGFGGAFLNPANFVANIYRRSRGGVEFGNPKNLSDKEIMDLAIDDALGQMLPYMAGTKDFEDIRENVGIGRKIARGVGDLLSFVVASPNKLAFESGMKLAAGLGAKKTIAGSAAEFAAGGAALAPLNAMEAPAPVEDYSVGKYLSDAASLVPESAISSAALGGVIHGAMLAARSGAARLNPLYQKLRETTPEDAAKGFSALSNRVKNGTAHESEVEIFNHVKDYATSKKIDFDKLVSGELGIGAAEETLRPWVAKTPILGDIAPQSRYRIYNPTPTRGAYAPEGQPPRGEQFNYENFTAKADEALRRAYPEPTFGGYLDAKNELALAPQHNIPQPTRADLARARAEAPNVSYGRIPIYGTGPVQSAQASLFGDELPASNDILDRSLVPVQEVPVDMIAYDHDLIPNFKAGADTKTGVIPGNELQGKYERVPSNPIIAWEPINPREDGKLVRGTGSHRLNHAIATGEKTIPTQVLREADGWTVEMVKALDAESNIRDGMGTVSDYADFFKNSPALSEPEAIERGLIARQKGKMGWDIGRNASDEVYDLYRNGKLSEGKAAAIAEGAPQNPDVQRAVLKQARSMNQIELGMFARNLDLRHRYDGNAALDTDMSGRQMDLFSEDSPWMMEMEKISRTQARMIKENLDKINAVRGAVSRPEAAKKMGVDVNNPDAIRDEIERLQIENRQIANPSGPVLQKIRMKAGLNPIEEKISTPEAPIKKESSVSALKNSDISTPEKFKSDLEAFKNGKLTSEKILQMGRPSELLNQYGIPDKSISMTQGIIKKALNHGLDYDAISQLPEQINDPVGIFSYPANGKVFDLLIELLTKDKNPIVASLEIAVERQRLGEVVDIRTVHPKENLGRIVDWAKKGRLMYWNKEKGRKLLQDSDPANWGRYETELAPFLPTTSANTQKSQGQSANGDVDGAVNAPKDYAVQNRSVSTEQGAPSNHTPSDKFPEGQALKDGGIKPPDFDSKPTPYAPEAGPAEKPNSKLWEAETPGAGHLKPRNINPNVAAPDDTPSMGDIRRYFEKALDLPIRHKTGKRGVLGYYIPQREVVRTSPGHSNDMRVISHEIGHDIHEKLFPRHERRAWQAENFFENPEIKKELYDFATKQFGEAYDPPARVGEGFAEYVHYWLMDPARAAAETPKFHALFAEQLEKYPDVKHILETGRAAIKRHFDAPAVERVLANIKSSSDRWSDRTVRERVEGLVNKLYTDWVDELNPLKRAQGELNALGANANFYDMATNYKGGALGKAEYSIMNRSLDINGKEIGPGLEQILNKVGAKNLDDLRAYIVARRAQVLHKRGLQSGISKADAAEVVSKLDSKFRKVSDQLDKFSDQQLRLYVDSGYLSEAQYRKIKAENDFYIPFHRFHEMVSGGQKGGQGFVNTHNPVKRLRGSDRELIDPIESMIKNAFLARDMAERNRVAASFVNALEGVQGSGRIADPFFRKWTPTTLKDGEIKDVLKSSGLADGLSKIGKDGNAVPLTKAETNDYLDKIIAENPIYRVIFREADATDPKNGVFKVWRNGKPDYYQLDDRDLYRALTLSDSKEMQALEKFPLMKLFTYPTRVLRSGAILDPNFATKNPIRDQAEAFVYSDNNFIPFISSIGKGMFEVLGKGKYYKEWQAAGGRFADFTSVDRANAERVLKDVLKNQNFVRRIGNYATNPLEALRAFTELTEMMTRVGEFKLAREAGKTPMQAANESKEITLNFSRSGKYGKIMNKIIPFFNAAVQDVDKFGRNFFNPKSPSFKKRWAKGILGLTAPTIALWYYNRNDEDIQALPAWRKNLFWNFKAGDGDTIWSIPKPFTPGQVFANLPERILDFVYDKDPKAVMDWAAQFVDSINPFALPPTIGVPMDILKNHSTFTGAPIEGMGLQSIVPSQRANANTSTSAIALADALSRVGLEVSPIKMDYAVQGFGGGLGKLAVSGADKLLERFSNIDLPPEPDGGWKRAPIAKSFNVNPLSSNKYVNDFYDEYQKIQQRTATVNRVADGKLTNSIGWIQRNIEQVAQDSGDKKRWDNVAALLGDLNDASAVIRNDKNISGPEKYNQLSEIAKIKNKVAKEFMLSIRTPPKAPK